jgi:ComF family protein
MVGSLLRNFVRALDDVVYPPHCLLTDVPLADHRFPISRAALDACQPAPSNTELMLTVQRHISEDEMNISSFNALWLVGSPFFADEIGRPSIDKAIYAIKYGGRTRLATRLGIMLGEYLTDGDVQVDFVCAVPIHSARKRERGYNQAEFIASGVAEAMHVPNIPALRRTRYTGTQTALSEHQRLGNVTGAFEVIDHNAVIGATILIVDDVLTTGATLNSCASALLEASARRIDAATLAAA